MNIKDQEKKVVILAANGQIGVELCMYLEDFENISLTAIVRTEYAATLLKKLDVKYISGDINEDGTVNILDVILTINIILGIDEINQLADLNNDGLINILDIVLIVNIILSD